MKLKKATMYPVCLLQPTVTMLLPQLTNLPGVEQSISPCFELKEKILRAGVPGTC